MSEQSDRRRAYQREWRKRRADSDAAWRKEQTEKRKAWRAANREHVNAQARGYLEKGRERGREYQRKRRAAMSPEERANASAQKRADRVAKRDAYREYGLRRNGWSLDLIEERWREQKGLCGMCGTPLDRARPRGMNADHDHERFVPRGLLCAPCNLALGHIEKHLDRALAYLKKWGSRG